MVLSSLFIGLSLLAASPYGNTPKGPGQQQEACAHLSQEEMAFAKHLSSMQMAIFCEIFTDADRKKAMALFATKRDNMTADGAVEHVITMSRDVSKHRNTQPPQKNKRSYYF